MRVLIVCSGNKSRISPFILEQSIALKKKGIEISFFTISGSGIYGYLKNFSKLIKKIRTWNPDLIHAHYGFSGLLASLNRKIPVIITYHGSDVNIPGNRKWTRVASKLARKNIFVSDQLAEIMKAKNYVVIPCGLDMDIFKPFDQIKARESMGLNIYKKYILFSSSFSNSVKNYPLAKAAMELLNIPDAELLELRNYDRKDVQSLINSADVCLLTSFSEGSPQFIKEAMACNCPIVSTDVGDVKEIFNNTAGCYLTSFEPADIADKIKEAITFGRRTDGKEKIIHFDNKLIADKLLGVYKNVINQYA